MTQTAEALINSISEMFSGSSQRYMNTLAPLMPKRREPTKATAKIRSVSVFHRDAVA